ncbi:MAG: aminoacyl-tRNA hydrolase [Ruminococcaceae bacterium]|nr:aminoacyl-tRNA hydrolase [Oscillospiraceae bacterium]
MANIFDLFKKIEKKDETAGSAPEYIVAGLGNPGGKYHQTRHNAGFMALDFIYEKLSVNGEKSKFKALVRDGSVAGKRVLFMKPDTFMNLSGEAVSEAAAFYKIPPERIIVISDDVNLAVGRIRVREKGSSGGQKGLENIILRMGTDNFPRIRIGVGAKPQGWEMADWVLGKIPEGDREDLFFALGSACTALETLIRDGAEAAMGKCNGLVPPKKDEDTNE